MQMTEESNKKIDDLEENLQKMKKEYSGLLMEFFTFFIDSICFRNFDILEFLGQISILSTTEIEMKEKEFSQNLQKIESLKVCNIIFQKIRKF
jgi:hypothetical protein